MNNTYSLLMTRRCVPRRRAIMSRRAVGTRRGWASGSLPSCAVCGPSPGREDRCPVRKDRPMARRRPHALQFYTLSLAPSKGHPGADRSRCNARRRSRRPLQAPPPERAVPPDSGLHVGVPGRCRNASPHRRTLGPPIRCDNAGAPLKRCSASHLSTLNWKPWAP
jgi:hypothetical protein